MTYHSQAGQDTFANNILKGKTNGFFVELGANHWRNVNNTIFFEQFLNWKGVMIEHIYLTTKNSGKTVSTLLKMPQK